jgi:hypothetical protein
MDFLSERKILAIEFKTAGLSASDVALQLQVADDKLGIVHSS